MRNWRQILGLKPTVAERALFAVQPTSNTTLKRLEYLEAQLADVVLGRKLERWANSQIAPELEKLEAKINQLEQNMATHADLPPVVQGLIQNLEGLGTKLEAALTELAETRTALEAQTDKYKATVAERDAAIERERIASQELDKHLAALAVIGDGIAKSKDRIEQTLNKSAA